MAAGRGHLERALGRGLAPDIGEVDSHLHPGSAMSAAMSTRVGAIDSAPHRCPQTSQQGVRAAHVESLDD